VLPEYYAQQTHPSTAPLQLIPAYGAYTSSSAASSAHMMYCDSQASSSRRSSVSPALTTPTYSANRGRAAKQGSESQSSGSHPEAKRTDCTQQGSAVDWCATCRRRFAECKQPKSHVPSNKPAKTVHKNQNEQTSRKNQGLTIANMEDALLVYAGFEVPTSQTKSNEQRSRLTGDKQQTLDAGCHLGIMCAQDIIEILLANGGPRAVEDYKASVRDRLSRGLAEGNAQKLPRDCWMVADTSDGDEDCCAVAICDDVCQTHGRTQIALRKMRRTARFQQRVQQPMESITQVVPSCLYLSDRAKKSSSSNRS